MPFLRVLLGLAMFPACWAALRTVYDAGAGIGADSWTGNVMAPLAGAILFALVFAPCKDRLMTTYVLGHELTHALFGLLFGAKPSRLRVSDAGGSVRLTKNNFVITLAPYFFPFWTFVEVLLAGAAYGLVGRLAGQEAWLFFGGVTWAFHLLFTIDVLSHRQPDLRIYGFVFSLALIVLMNALFLLVVLVGLTQALTFAQVRGLLAGHLTDVYGGLWTWAQTGVQFVLGQLQERKTR